MKSTKEINEVSPHHKPCMSYRVSAEVFERALQIEDNLYLIQDTVIVTDTGAFLFPPLPNDIRDMEMEEQERFIRNARVWIIVQREKHMGGDPAASRRDLLKSDPTLLKIQESTEITADQIKTIEHHIFPQVLFPKEQLIPDLSEKSLEGIQPNDIHSIMQLLLRPGFKKSLFPQTLAPNNLASGPELERKIFEKTITKKYEDGFDYLTEKSPRSARTFLRHYKTQFESRELELDHIFPQALIGSIEKELENIFFDRNTIETCIQQGIWPQKIIKYLVSEVEYAIGHPANWMYTKINNDKSDKINILAFYYLISQQLKVLHAIQKDLGISQHARGTTDESDTLLSDEALMEYFSEIAELKNRISTALSGSINQSKIKHRSNQVEFNQEFRSIEAAIRAQKEIGKRNCLILPLKNKEDQSVIKTRKNSNRKNRLIIETTRGSKGLSLIIRSADHSRLHPDFRLLQKNLIESLQRCGISSS